MNIISPIDADLDNLPFGNASVSERINNVLSMKRDVVEDPDILNIGSNRSHAVAILNDFTNTIHPEWCSASEQVEIIELFMVVEGSMDDCDCPDCRGE